MAAKHTILTMAERKAIARTIQARRLTRLTEREIVYSHLDAHLIDVLLELVERGFRPKLEALAAATELSIPTCAKYLREWETATGFRFGKESCR